VTFRIENLIAMPMEPSIRVRLSPEEIIEVSQASWESQKDSFMEWALSLPGIEQSIGWKLLKPYTGNNGMLAKLTIALGDLAKIWRMYPSPDQPALWGRTHPCIMELRKLQESPRTVPKPSAGDLDPTAFCTCCERGMGPSGTTIHDLEASDENTELCLECDLQCGPRASSCQLRGSKEKKAAQYRPPETREQEIEEENIISLDGAEFQKYADQFRE